MCLKAINPSYTTPTGRETITVPHADRLGVSQPAFDAAMAAALERGTAVAYRFDADGWADAGQAWHRVWVR